MMDILVDQIRMALRNKNKVFDELEIMPIIKACKIDLSMAGVVYINEEDPMFIRAATLYAKANFGFFEDSEKYDRAYEKLKHSMALSSDYGTIGAKEEENE